MVIKADKSDLETLFFRRMQLIISPVFSAWRNNKMHCSWNSHEFCRAQHLEDTRQMSCSGTFYGIKRCSVNVIHLWLLLILGRYSTASLWDLHTYVLKPFERSIQSNLWREKESKCLLYWWSLCGIMELPRPGVKAIMASSCFHLRLSGPI
ncbi:uncharacterized protein RHO17_015798 isoform 2-T2 [Thomomys bottae]